MFRSLYLLIFLFVSCDSKTGATVELGTCGENQKIIEDKTDNACLSKVEKPTLAKGINNEELYAWYYEEKMAYDRAGYLVLFSDSQPVWLVHPASDFGRPFPHKGIRTKSDTVLVEAPFENGNIGYYGLFINHLAIGNHLVYFSNGNIKFSVNYDLNILKEYDSIGNVLKVNNSYNRNLESGSVRGLVLENLENIVKVY